MSLRSWRRDRARQRQRRSRRRSTASSRGAHRRDRAAIALGVGRVLVAGEEAGRALDQLVERLGVARRRVRLVQQLAAAPPGRRRRGGRARTPPCCSRPRRRSARSRAASPPGPPAPGRAARRSPSPRCWRRSSRRGTPRASACASIVSTRSAPAANSIFSSSASTLQARHPGCESDSATGISCVLASTRVRPWRTVCSASAEAATTMSQASTASACCASMRTWFSGRRVLGEAHERQHRAALLREAHEVEHARRMAFEVRRHRDHRADRDDAGAADAGDQQVVRAGPGMRRRQRQLVDLRPRTAPRPGRRARRALLQAAADHADEARAEAVGAGVVLVAARLVDLALAARARSRAARTATQFDCTEQSPQPSQTRSLMKRRRAGSTSSPFFRRRRFSAAQVCS